MKERSVHKQLALHPETEAEECIQPCPVSLNEELEKLLLSL
jgi:hypothetical protein